MGKRRGHGPGWRGLGTEETPMESQEAQSPVHTQAFADEARSSATSCWGTSGSGERPTQGPGAIPSDPAREPRCVLRHLGLEVQSKVSNLLLNGCFRSYWSLSFFLLSFHCMTWISFDSICKFFSSLGACVSVAFSLAVCRDSASWFSTLLQALWGYEGQRTHLTYLAWWSVADLLWHSLPD